MPIVNITLEDILRAHDTRADAQRRLLRTYRLPLVSFTMNIAGPVKFSPLIELAFDAGLEALRTTLGQPVAAEIIRPATGCEALLVYDRPAAALKAACLTLETATPVGRLYDLDVLDTDGNKLSRLEQRTCLICGGPVTVCSRSRAHGLDAIVNRTREILMDFAARYLAGLAAKALTEEVRLTPKPGLIDERNNGAHSDMDLPLFLRSIGALTPWLRRITALSLSGADAAALQAAGLEAETAMFQATGGVNIHKGGAVLLFSAAGGAGPVSNGGRRCVRPRRRVGCGADATPGHPRCGGGAAPSGGRSTHGSAVRFPHRPKSRRAAASPRSPDRTPLADGPHGGHQSLPPGRCGGGSLCKSPDRRYSGRANGAAYRTDTGAGRGAHRPVAQSQRQCRPAGAGTVPRQASLLAYALYLGKSSDHGELEKLMP